jgi:hypothetical protein
VVSRPALMVSPTYTLWLTVSLDAKNGRQIQAWMLRVVAKSAECRLSTPLPGKICVSSSRVFRQLPPNVTSCAPRTQFPSTSVLESGRSVV